MVFEGYSLIREDLGKEFIIYLDENVGYYFIIIDIELNRSIADYLCDDLESAFDEAKSLYGVERGDFLKKIVDV